jgi:hypothetical protein
MQAAEVTDQTLGSWTRTKNDNITCAYDTSKNDELFRFVTYSTDYLKQGSCAAGNTHNCNVFNNIDVNKESRFGKLTNLNEIQRATTNDRTMGLRTTPNFTTGKLLDPRLLQDMATMEAKLEHHTRLDMPSTSQMNEHHFEERRDPPKLDLFPRNGIDLSSRVLRRNAFAEQCAKGAAPAP